MQRDHEFHTEGPDLFPPPDTLNALPPPLEFSPMENQGETDLFDLERYELRGVQGHINFERLSWILFESDDERLEELFDALQTLMVNGPGEQEDLPQLLELEQQMVERADALDPNVFAALDPSVRTMTPPGVESPMVCPTESEPPLVGGDPATWSPYAMDGTLVHTPPPAPEHVVPAYAVIAA